MQQVLRAILMLGLLPGLLLPGGWSLRICLCGALFGSQREASTSCCDEPAEPSPSCCAGCCSTDADPDSPAGPAAGTNERCGCIFLSAPEQPPVQLPSGAGIPADLAALPPPPEPGVVRALVCVAAARELADLLPEPPGKRRNLPLLI